MLTKLLKTFSKALSGGKSQNRVSRSLLSVRKSNKNAEDSILKCFKRSFQFVGWQPNVHINWQKYSEAELLLEWRGADVNGHNFAIGEDTMRNLALQFLYLLPLRISHTSAPRHHSPWIIYKFKPCFSAFYFYYIIRPLLLSLLQNKVRDKVFEEGVHLISAECINF